MRKLEGARLSIASDLDAEMLSWSVVPFHIIDFAEIMTSQIEKLKIIQNNQTVVNMHVNMHKRRTIPTRVE